MGLINEKLNNYNKYNTLDYFNLPEGSPYQLIEGELVMTPAPITYHQTISRNLERIIFNHVEKNNSGFAYDAPIDVYLDDNNAYQPDIIFISRQNSSIIKDKGILGAPDLIIEILSMSTSYYDTEIKKDIYEKSGVKEYLIIDPIKQTVKSFIKNDKTDKFILNTDLDIKKDKKLTIQTLNLEVELEEIFKKDI
jgi:Uma2 family endonuclease